MHSNPGSADQPGILDFLIRPHAIINGVICFVLLTAFLVPASDSPQQTSDIKEAWALLEGGIHHKNTDQRPKAVEALSLLVYSRKAAEWAEEAFSDPQSEVRISAAHTLARIADPATRPKLRQALKDPDVTVVIAVANALYALKDPMASEVYYSLLTGERKTSNGLVKSQLDQLKNTKYLERLAFQTGLGFVPFGGMGYQAWRTLTANDSSAIRALAAERLSKSPDAKTLAALRVACTDKKWQVRAAAVSALGQSGIRSQKDTVTPLFYDDNDVVRYDAAVAYINLESHRHRGNPGSLR